MTLSIRSVLSRMMDMVKQRIGPLIGMAVLYYVVQIVLTFLFFGAIGASIGAMAMAGGSPFDTGLGFGMIFSMLIFYIVFLLLYFAQSISMTHHASPVLTPEFGESFMVGIKSMPTLLGLTLIMIVAYIAFAIVAGIASIPFALMGDTGSVLYVILLIVLTIYIACRLMLVMPVIAVDGVTNPITAVQRSWALTRGNALKIFLAYAAFIVLLVAAIFILVLVFGGSMAALTDPTMGMSAMSGGLAVILILGFMLMMVVVYVVITAFMASLHAALAGPETLADTFG